MAATVGELVVNLTARTAQFDKNLRSSGRQTDRFAKHMETAKRAAVSLGAGLVGLMAVGRVASWFRKGAAEIDRMAKVSRKLGTTVEELNALRHAADLAGIGASTLDMALQRMTRRISEAAIGTGEAQAAIKELGLDAQKLALAGPYRAFLMFADALEKIPNPADRVRIGFKMLDSEGVELINMATGGSKALEELRKKVDAIGGATTAGAANVERFNDALTKMGFVATQGGRNRFIETMAGIFREGHGMFADYQKGGAFPGPITAMAKLFRGEQAMKDALARGYEAGEAKEKQKLLLEAQRKQKLAEHLAAGRAMIPEVGIESLTQLEEMTQKWREQGMAIGQAADEMDKIISKTRAAAEANRRWDEEIKKREEAIAKQQEAERKRAAQLGTLRGMIGQAMGGDGASLALPAAAGRDSAAAYSAIVRHGMQDTGKKSITQIAKDTHKMMQQDSKRNQIIGDVVQEMKRLGLWEMGE